MKKVIRILSILLITLMILCSLIFGGVYGYVRYRMNRDGLSYTYAVERIIVEQVPEQGITVQGRQYDADSVYRFLEEIRYDPYNYIHKDHHCILQYVPEKQIYWIVNILRITMGCQ